VIRLAVGKWNLANRGADRTAQQRAPDLALHLGAATVGLGQALEITDSRDAADTASAWSAAEEIG
jgi:hypothetical protein